MGVHRIRLIAAWKPVPGERVAWERVFHAPTGLGPQARVRLCLRASESPSAVILNGATLWVDVGNGSDSPVDFEVENQRICRRVEGMLAPVNRLVVIFPGETPPSAQPLFDLEHERRPRPAPEVIECSLEIDEDAV
ncbi:MAG: hypothetical protein GYA33_01210 [Thermogutta sp.]|nr:hypothetical protein [Thermogutta sp.]